MNLPSLRHQLLQIEQRIQALHNTGTIFPISGCWVGCSTPGARSGEVRTEKQYHVRSRHPVFDGKKSRYLKPSEVGNMRAQIERRRSLDKLTKQQEILLAKLDTIYQTARDLGLSIPD